MYEVIDQKEMKVPTAQLGEELRVGPVTLDVSAHSLTYFAADIRTPDGSIVSKASPRLFVVEFRVQIHNNGNGPLDLDGRKAYWVANERHLYRTGGIDPQANWFVIGSTPNMRRLVLPDPERMKGYGYELLPIETARWAYDLGLRPLPSRVEPGGRAEGSIILIHSAEGNDDAYLFFGNWLTKKAWGRVRIGSFTQLMNETIRSVGPNPPDPLEVIIDGEGYGPGGIEFEGLPPH